MAVPNTMLALTIVSPRRYGVGASAVGEGAVVVAAIHDHLAGFGATEVVPPVTVPRATTSTVVDVGAPITEPDSSQPRQRA